MPNRLGTANLYGSARLGSQHPEALVYPRLPNQGPADLSAGSKRYELTNHLGNVLSTVSDLLTPVDTDNNNTTDHFAAIVHNQQAYYPFGMLMPSLQYTPPGERNTRYGFNGKENDDEVKGRGIQQDYGMRYYDTRLGKFLSLDPLAQRFPYYSPYQFAGDKPIIAIDLDGLEDVWVHKYLGENGAFNFIQLRGCDDNYHEQRQIVADELGLDLSMLPSEGILTTESDATGRIIRFHYLPTPEIVEDKPFSVGQFFEGIMPKSNAHGSEEVGFVRSGRDGMRTTMEVVDEAGFYVNSFSLVCGPYKGLIGEIGKGMEVFSAVGLTIADIDEYGLETGLVNGGIRAAGFGIEAILQNQISTIPQENGRSLVEGLFIPVGKAMDNGNGEIIENVTENMKD